jgi:hypothetical protein
MNLDLSRPRIIRHLLKGACFGLAAFRLGLLAAGWDWPGSLLAAAVVWLLVAGLVRNTHALFVAPRMELHPDSLRLRYWKPIRFPSWAMFLPVNQVVDVTIPWSEFVGCRTLRSSGGDPWNYWQELLVETSNAPHAIGSDVFARSIDRLWSEIHAYQESEFHAPARRDLDVPGFNAQRFTRSVQLARPESRTDAVSLGCGVVLAVILLPLVVVFAGAVGSLVLLSVAFALAFVPPLLGTGEWGLGDNPLMQEVSFAGGKMPLAVLLGVAGGELVLLALLVRSCLREWSADPIRILQLRFEGIAFGPRLADLTVIPWRDVLSAAVVTERNRRTVRGSTLTTTSQWLEVIIRGRRPLIITSEIGRDLGELCELIAPPVSKVALARQLQATGLDAESAATAAGLPATRSHG